MTDRRPDKQGGGGDPAGLPLPKAIDAACAWAALHRIPGTDPVGAYEATLARIVLLAVPAFERALKEDLAARFETRWLAARRRADQRKRAIRLAKMPLPWRARLREVSRKSDAMILPHLTRPGGRPRHAVNVLVEELADIWRSVTGQPAQRRHVGDGGRSPGEVFIAWAAGGLRDGFASMPEAIRSQEAEKHLAGLTMNGIAERLKPRKSGRK